MTSGGAAIHVVKLGGSLLDLPDLRQRFDLWRAAELGPRGVLVVGGGKAADLVRAFDRALRLEPERAHWLAVRAMQLNAHLLAAVLPAGRLAATPADCAAAWAAGELAILEPLAWLEREAASGLDVPHRWTFTSDSIAAHVAAGLGAAKLTLLKSTLPPPEGLCDPARAAALGVVDEDFPRACANVPAVELVNLRASPPPRCVLR